MGAVTLISVEEYLNTSWTRETRFRLPDMAVELGKGEGRYLAKAPFIAVEILSEDDRMTRVIEKLKEYAEWGVPQHPGVRSAYQADVRV